MMMMMSLRSFKLLFNFLVVLAALTKDGGECAVSGDWDYGANGPDAWFVNYAQCSGSAQSPINIETNEVVYEPSLLPFVFTNYNWTDSWNVTNTERAITVYPGGNGSGLYELTGSNLPSTFKLAQFHFHWGMNQYQGSEHFINNKKCPLELHLVHTDTSGQDGYVVLGFLFEISNTSNPALDDLVTAARHTADIDSFESLDFNIMSILPKNLTAYYRYYGSLTTPPCSENVIWNVFADKIYISVQQMENFWADYQKTNWREPQPLNKRMVQASFMGYDGPSFSHAISSSRPFSFLSYFSSMLAIALLSKLFL